VKCIIFLFYLNIKIKLYIKLREISRFILIVKSIYQWVAYLYSSFRVKWIFYLLEYLLSDRSTAILFFYLIHCSAVNTQYQSIRTFRAIKTMIYLLSRWCEISGKMKQTSSQRPEIHVARLLLTLFTFDWL